MILPATIVLLSLAALDPGGDGGVCLTSDRSPAVAGVPAHTPFWIDGEGDGDRFQYLWSPAASDWLGCWHSQSRTYRAWLPDRKRWSAPQPPPWTAADRPETASRPAVLHAPSGLRLLAFRAEWCGPCQRMGPALAEVERRGYAVERHDIAREPALARRYQVSSIPCFVLVRDGREVARVVGATTAERLMALFRDHDSGRGPGDGRDADPTEPEAGGPLNFGVDLGRLDLHRGVEVYHGPKAAGPFIAAARGAQVDDSHSLHLTIIGTPDERAPVLVDLRAGKLGPTETLRVQDYPPDHWAVTGVGLPPGHPSVVVQDADGTVLHRQADYAGGAEALAAALRKADPHYRPDRDPDLRGRRSLGLTMPAWAMPVAILALVLVAVLAMPSRPSNQTGPRPSAGAGPSIA